MNDVDVNIVRINNFEYSFCNSTKNGMRHIIKALTYINPNPFVYNRKIEKFNRKKLTFKIGMLSSVEKYVKEHNVSYQINDYIFDLPEGIKIDKRMSGKYIHQKNF